MKVIVDTQSDKVVGIHYYGAKADEIITGFTVAMKMGLTKKQLDSCVGIHPSIGEDFYNLDITKRSGKPYQKTSC